jgi:hypothetical protein
MRLDMLIIGRGEVFSWKATDMAGSKFTESRYRNVVDFKTIFFLCRKLKHLSVMDKSPQLEEM